jgi:enamine deaminase RidA (YjgF/YER057c/UK114 family)
MNREAMVPEEEFERALQRYEQACAEWKLAITCYVRDVGQVQAMPKLEEAHNRICRVDAVFLSPEEVKLRASRATPIVDER